MKRFSVLFGTLLLALLPMTAQGAYDISIKNTTDFPIECSPVVGSGGDCRQKHYMVNAGQTVRQSLEPCAHNGFCNGADAVYLYCVNSDSGNTEVFPCVSSPQSYTYSCTDSAGQPARELSNVSHCTLD